MRNTIKELQEANPENFEEFFPLYLSAHSNIANRWLHFIGATIALLLIPVAIVLDNYLILLLCPLFGYGLAWFGHFFLESNIPASYRNPLWSIRGDFRMYIMMCQGKLWS